MIIDWTISVGNILTLAAFVAAGIAIIVAVRRDVAVLSTRMIPLESAITRLSDILEKIARQDERLKAVERDIERNDPRKQWGQSSSRQRNPHTE